MFLNILIAAGAVVRHLGSAPLSIGAFHIPGFFSSQLFLGSTEPVMAKFLRIYEPN
jgi:hypothetical protein